MLVTISKKTREEAAFLASIWASTPSGWSLSDWSREAIDLFTLAFIEALGHQPGSYKGEYDRLAHEAGAEAEAMLRTGWTPAIWPVNRAGK